jgi:hypothetical protein
LAAASNNVNAAREIALISMTRPGNHGNGSLSACLSIPPVNRYSIRLRVWISVVSASLTSSPSNSTESSLIATPPKWFSLRASPRSLSGVID